MQRGQTRGDTARIKRGMRHGPDPGECDVQRGRTRGETARKARGVGHGLLSLMAAREGIGRVRFHRAPPRENLPLPTSPESGLFDAKLLRGGVVYEYSSVWVQEMEKEFEELASAEIFGDM